MGADGIPKANIAWSVRADFVRVHEASAISVPFCDDAGGVCVGARWTPPPTVCMTPARDER